MEFPACTNVSFVPLFLVLVSCSTILNPIFAATTCSFPPIFNMGDSNSDTGSMSAAFTAFNLPNGETYFQTPSGRYSDGRFLIDFMARSLDLPYLSAYLDSLGANFSHGANFAASSATIRLPQKVIPAEGGWSPFYLPVQYEQFKQFKIRAQKIREQGGIFAELMPKKEYFGQALYTFDIGQNDLSTLLVDNTPFDEVTATIPDIIYQFTGHVKKMYELGGRSFWIHNTGPIGCLSFTLTHFPSARKDVAGCALAYKDAVLQLRKDLPLAALTYVDVYSVKYSLFRYPSRNSNN
ncbi:hypothetical protein Tsubulata_038405 [Turnera subulata]|uniref:Alpha-L-fucosidase n=1 Tax=Turnera subulata TaxID=218843 RepID=A0A9Q0G9Y1_9ROSI|nr:hypothetical protein Tsubulata_038405 [Turnera subulata]